MGIATVETLTREDAKRERDELLQGLGMALDEVRELAEDYSLTATQAAKWRRIEELTWLLGE